MVIERVQGGSREGRRNAVVHERDGTRVAKALSGEADDWVIGKTVRYAVRARRRGVATDDGGEGGNVTMSGSEREMRCVIDESDGGRMDSGRAIMPDGLVLLGASSPLPMHHPARALPQGAVRRPPSPGHTWEARLSTSGPRTATAAGSQLDPGTDQRDQIIRHR